MAVVKHIRNVNTSEKALAITISEGAKLLVWLNTRDLESVTLI